MASSLDNAGTGQYCQMVWVRLARRKGVREKPVIESPSRRVRQLEPGGSGLVSNAYPRMAWGTSAPVDVAGAKATVNACGVTVAMLQGHSWAPTPLNGSSVNVGTILVVPSSVSSQLIEGKTYRRLMPSGWGGGPVVVRGRESRSHGEGAQCVRRIRANPGGRW